MTGIYFCDTEEEKEEYMKDLEENPDFSYIGVFDMIQDLYHDLNDQGFTDEQLDQFSINRYGTCLEIIEYCSEYTVFFGTR